MTSYQKAIYDKLDEFRWEIAGYEDCDAWWADETWKLRSIRHSSRCEVFLIFLVDPEAKIHGRKRGESIWAVKASAALPMHWLENANEYVLRFGGRWQCRVPELFEYLDELRRQ